MARLIDADVAMQRFIQESEYSGVNVVHINTIKRLLQDIDTAYDVEKVVECLEEKVELAHKRYVDCPVNSPCYERYRTQYNERRMCLDIVEGGGVNDD